MERNACSPKPEQTTKEDQIKKAADDALTLLYQISNVSLVLDHCLYHACDFTQAPNLIWRSGIEQGAAAILEWQHERAKAVADALGDAL